MLSAFRCLCGMARAAAVNLGQPELLHHPDRIDKRGMRDDRSVVRFVACVGTAIDFYERVVVTCRFFVQLQDTRPCAAGETCSTNSRSSATLQLPTSSPHFDSMCASLVSYDCTTRAPYVTHPSFCVCRPERHDQNAATAPHGRSNSNSGFKSLRGWALKDIVRRLRESLSHM